MATIKFFTRTDIDKLAPVYMRLTDTGGINIIVKTPLKMVPAYWNEKKQICRDDILDTEIFSKQDARNVEDRFYQLKDFILKAYFNLSGPVTPDWLKTTIDKYYYKDSPNIETLNEYINRFVDEATSGKRLATAGNTKKRYSYGSLRVLRGFKLSFNTFQGIENDGVKPRKGVKVFPKRPYKPLNWNDVSIDTYNDFVEFFYGRGCGSNYIGKHIKTFKTIMRSAREEGLHNNMEIERKAFKTLSEEVEHIYLTESELKKLFDLDLSENKHYQEVRDVFLAGCYTAQRYSDYSKLNKSNLKVIGGNKYVELIQKKTGEKCIIPVRPELDVILQRYDYDLPKSFEQKVNKAIKKIGEMAEITELIHTEKNKGGLIKKTNLKKCDLISTHCARRTGVTLMYLAGIPVVDIMKISGHRTPKEFMKYIRISKEETAVKLATHPYFIGNSLKVAK
ncbi:MAG TPA: site-specific integrase [Bacteroidales bacterium]|nr:site-specific integrase [Bacteroidales bacterium]